jgi:hypothetical protein
MDIVASLGVGFVKWKHLLITVSYMNNIRGVRSVSVPAFFLTSLDRKRVLPNKVLDERCIGLFYIITSLGQRSLRFPLCDGRDDHGVMVHTEQKKSFVSG